MRSAGSFNPRLVCHCPPSILDAPMQSTLAFSTCMHLPYCLFEVCLMWELYMWQVLKNRLWDVAWAFLAVLIQCRLGGGEATVNVLVEERHSCGSQGIRHKHRPSRYLFISESFCGQGYTVGEGTNLQTHQWGRPQTGSLPKGTLPGSHLSLHERCRKWDALMGGIWGSRLSYSPLFPLSWCPLCCLRGDLGASLCLAWESQSYTTLYAFIEASSSTGGGLGLLPQLFVLCTSQKVKPGIREAYSSLWLSLQ